MIVAERLFTKTLRLRIKDKHIEFLKAQAREVNFVWNFVNDLSVRILRRERRFASAYDLQKYTNGASKEGLSLHAQTIQAISEEYATRRRQFRKSRLAWRRSQAPHRSLGWIPVKADSLKYLNGQIRYGKHFISLWDSYGLASHRLGAGSFSEDARGRWYLNVTVKIERPAPRAEALPSVGIDLGLKDIATTSDGVKLENARFFRDLEQKIAIAQRAHKKARVQALHAKVSNRRKDALHKFSTRLVAGHGAIFVGNVNAPQLAKKTRMAKSVMDAGWGILRTMLDYKSDYARAWFEIVNEARSTQDCNACGSRTGPSGLAGLGIREWDCPHCHAHHDRDINAARNILAAGRRRLTVGIPSF